MWVEKIGAYVVKMIVMSFEVHVSDVIHCKLAMCLCMLIFKDL